MALDVALAKTDGENFKPVLRFFSWKPAAISLGFHQSLDDINTELCAKNGVDVVIRPTGGRAILHASELTYSVILPHTSQYFHKDILPVYDTISKSLVAGLQYLGLPVVFERAEKTPKDFSKGELSSICYTTSVQHEIGIDGKKLVGSAQRRFEKIVLQHGSILIGPDHLDLPLYLTRGNENRKQAMKSFMEKKTTYLNQLGNFTYESIANSIKKGFEQSLSIDFKNDNPSAAELKAADELLEKYSAFKA
jgi:lipoyl(octanoyl) transferase